MNLHDLKTGLSKRTIREQVSERLAHMIQSGLLRPSDELPSERELAKTLEVSRETVRGAIQALAAVGMVEIGQGSRTRVIGRSAFPLGGIKCLLLEEVLHIHEARQTVEIAVVRLAIHRIGDADRDRLVQLVEAQREMRDDPVSFLNSDAEFHHIIYCAGGNPRLSLFLNEMYSLGQEVRRDALRHAGAVERSLSDHEAIVSAFVAGNANAAEDALRRHSGRIRDTIAAGLGG